MNFHDIGYFHHFQLFWGVILCKYEEFSSFEAINEIRSKLSRFDGLRCLGTFLDGISYIFTASTLFLHMAKKIPVFGIFWPLLPQIFIYSLVIPNVFFCMFLGIIECIFMILDDFDHLSHFIECFAAFHKFELFSMILIYFIILFVVLCILIAFLSIEMHLNLLWYFSVICNVFGPIFVDFH